MTCILIVDDDAAFRDLLSEILIDADYEVLEAENGALGLQLASRSQIDLVITDQRMPELDGLTLIGRLRSLPKAPKVILMTAYGSIPQAVEAMRAGAVDYLTKPLESPAALRDTVRRVLGSPPATVVDDDFLTRDPAVLELLGLADRAAATGATILITGESGTGKEVVARRIHGASPRAAGPFIAVNCAALPESLAESTFFGHEKGSFTGADARRIGLLEAADGGTLFLDEVGELAQSIQGKLLRAIEERCIVRVGSDRSQKVDIRVIAATNRNLEAEIEQRRFRSDLYYRLAVVTLHLPPLRDRPGDVEIIAERLLDQAATRLGLPRLALASEALARLQGYEWPGNVRELRNVLERALIASTGEQILPADLSVSPSQLGKAGETGERVPEVLGLRERERHAILVALEQSGGNRKAAAKLLEISVRTLYNRLKELGMS